MRICLISGEYPPMQGGVGDYTREMARAMSARGHQIVVVTSIHAAAQQKDEDFTLLPVVSDWGWSVWKSLCLVVAHEQPDIINIQYQTAAFGMKPAINLLPWRMGTWRNPRPASVVTFHDLLVPFLFRGAGPLRRGVTDHLARRTDGIIATNEEDYADLSTRAPATPRRLIPIGPNVMPESLEHLDRESWRARWGIRDHQLALSYFGFLNQSKGGEELIEALARLVGEGRDAKLLMIGGKVGASDPTNQSYLARVESLIDRLNLRERVIWTGYLPAEETSGAFHASDICVLPYRDGLSTRRGTLMAALAHGLPIVSTQPRVPLVQFQDGENVLLVPPMDADALAGAIARLADDDVLRSRLAAGAAALAAQFTWPAIAESTLAFYADVLEDRNK